jgi:hypothetical protein
MLKSLAGRDPLARIKDQHFLKKEKHIALRKK